MAISPRKWTHYAGAFALAAAPLLLIGQYLGHLPEQTLRYSALYAALYGVCLWTESPTRLPVSDSAWNGPSLLKRLGAIGGVALVYALFQGVEYQDLTIIAPDQLYTQVALGAAGLSLLVAGLFPTISTGRLLVALLASGLALRGLGLGVWEIDPGTRDMLALVESAHDHFLGGTNPYAIHTMQPGSEIPLTYLPGLWLGYLPPRLLDFDIRWMGVLSDLFVVGSLWWAARGNDKGRRPWAEAGVFLFACVWLFLPSVHWNGIYAEPHVWWGVLAILLGAIARDRWWIAAAALGVAIVTRHYGVIVLPFVLLAMWRRLGWRAMVPRLALCGAVTAALLVPFVAADPDTFWFGTFRWLREYGPAHEGWFHNKLGFSGAFYEADLDDWLIRIQVAGVGAIFLAALANRRLSSRRVFAFCGTAYLWFVMFNGIIWYSFYLGAFLFVAFSLVSRSDPQPDVDGGPEGAALATSGVILAAALAAGAWIGWTVIDASSHRGLDRARTYLEESMKPGDALLDRSDWDLAFIDGTTVFDETDPPGEVDIGHGLFDGFYKPAGALSSERIWAIARPGRNGEWLDRVASLGESRGPERFGRYRAIVVDPSDKTRVLSQHFGELSVAYRPDGGERSSGRKTEGDDGTPTWRIDAAPGWVKVRPHACTIGGRKRRVIDAHPTDTGALTITWEDVRLGSRLVLAGGLQDPIVKWGRSDVRVDVRIDGRERPPTTVENRRGMQWRAYDTSGSTGERADVEMTIPTDDASQRWVCIDAIVLGD